LSLSPLPHVAVFAFDHSLEHAHRHDWSAVEIERDQLSQASFVLRALHGDLNLKVFSKRLL